MNSVSMQNNIMNIESNSSHMFISHWSFFSSPLESWFKRISNFVHVLDSFCHIDQNVRTLVFRSITPDFQGIIFVPSIIFNHFFGSFFRILFSTSFSFFNIVLELHIQRTSSNIKSIMFIWRFSHTNLIRSGIYSFFVCNNWFWLNNFNVAIFFL